MIEDLAPAQTVATIDVVTLESILVGPVDVDAYGPKGWDEDLAIAYEHQPLGPSVFTKRTRVHNSSPAKLRWRSTAASPSLPTTYKPSASESIAPAALSVQQSCTVQTISPSCE